MAVDRLLPTQEAEDLLALTRELADKELATRVEEHERAETYPEGLFATLGEAGLLGLPYPEEHGGGGPAVRGLPAGPRGARRRAGRPSPSRSACTGCRASRWRPSAPPRSRSGGCPACSPAS